MTENIQKKDDNTAEIVENKEIKTEITVKGQKEIISNLEQGIANNQAQIDHFNEQIAIEQARLEKLGDIGVIEAAAEAEKEAELQTESIEE